MGAVADFQRRLAFGELTGPGPALLWKLGLTPARTPLEPFLATMTQAMNSSCPDVTARLVLVKRSEARASMVTAAVAATAI